MAELKTCTNCGSVSTDEMARYCPKCGNPLRAQVEFYDAFISYRREGGSHLAQLIRTSLQYARGMNLFVDVNELRSGEFDRELLAKIEVAPNFIVILSRGALERCKNEGDWLRQEIVHALSHGKNIIPVLVKGFVMPRAEELPADIRKLTSMNGVGYDDLFTEEAIRKIGDWCKLDRRNETADQSPRGEKPTLETTETLDAASSEPPKPRLRASAWAALAAASVAMATSGVWYFGKPTPEEKKVVERHLSPEIGKAWTIPDLNLEMVSVPPGDFTMGSPDPEDERLTQVRLTKPFWLGKYEVTQRQWTSLMGENPSEFKKAGGRAPVEQVSYDDALAFCRKLTQQEQAAGRLPLDYVYTLPTEAQWQYAWRGWTIGDYSKDPGAIGWNADNSGETTHPVGQKRPNGLGLYDMYGNVSEWCLDWFAPLPGGTLIDPRGPEAPPKKGLRVIAGQDWSSEVAHDPKGHWGATLGGVRMHGFRLALSSIQ